jgi:3-oxoadipate enol-lactonase
MASCELYHELAGAGEAPPLLFSGSLGSTLEMWAPQVQALSGARRLIRFDQRGHGRSPIPPGPYTIDDLGGDVLGLLDRLGVRCASYCGLSIGGMVGIWLAVNAPQRIDRLILICTSAHLPPAAGWTDRADAVRASGTPEVVADAVIERWFTHDFAEQHHDLVAGYRAMIAATPAEGYAGCCEAIAGFDLRARLPGITSPTLVIAGVQDSATPPAHAQLIATSIPAARLVILDNAAHLANVQQADATNRLITDHLEQQERR